jgi:N-acetyl-anhydromuramyl-L-alanine amidase AmpD
VGYGFANIDGVFMQYTQSIVQAFNRHFCREVFVIEQVIANRTILDERNQRWYRVSQERLNYLLADMSSR